MTEEQPHSSRHSAGRSTPSSHRHHSTWANRTSQPKANAPIKPHLMSRMALNMLDLDRDLYKALDALHSAVTREYELMHGEGMLSDPEQIKKTNLALHIMEAFLTSPQKRNPSLLLQEPLSWALEFSQNEVLAHDTYSKDKVEALRNALNIEHINHVMCDEDIERLVALYQKPAALQASTSFIRKTKDFTPLSSADMEAIQNDRQLKQSISELVIAAGAAAHMNATPASKAKDALLAHDILSVLDKSQKSSSKTHENKQAIAWALGVLAEDSAPDTNISKHIENICTALNIDLKQARLDRSHAARLQHIVPPAQSFSCG